jgi:hypothetical protein
MDVTESVIVDFSKEPNDIDSDAMMVEETQNSSSFTRSKEVIVILLSYTYSHIIILKFSLDKCCNAAGHGQ